MEQLAINGGTPSKTKPFPKWPYSDNNERVLIDEVLSSGNWWRMTGDKLVTFEEEFAKAHSVDYCLGVTNGTHAIELALTALGIKRGDEVIVPAVTFISTASAVLYVNATPVLVDVDPVTFCMMPEAFERAITPKTKAVIPVHMAGHACDMEQICSIAKKYGIAVIEDAAHGHGGQCNHRMIGSYGDMSIFSFQNGKIMTCGEGGAVITRHKHLYEQAYLIHGVGRPRGDRVYEHRVLGSNYRMNEFSAAILLAQLHRLPKMNAKREENARLLDLLLADVEGIIPQGRKEYATRVTHYMYMFYYDQAHFNGLSRSDFIECLIAEGIPAFICFPVLSDTAFFRQNDFHSRIDANELKQLNDISNARKIAAEVIWIPHFTLLGDRQDVQEIVAAIKKIKHAVCRRM